MKFTVKFSEHDVQLLKQMEDISAQIGNARDAAADGRLLEATEHGFQSRTTLGSLFSESAHGARERLATEAAASSTSENTNAKNADR